MAAPRHVLLELDDDDDDRSIASACSAALGIESSATSFSARGDLRSPPPPYRAGPGARADRGDVQVLGRVLGQEKATVDGVLHQRERQDMPP